MINITGSFNTAVCFATTLEDGAREQIKQVCDSNPPQKFSAESSPYITSKRQSKKKTYWGTYCKAEKRIIYIGGAFLLFNRQLKNLV